MNLRIIEEIKNLKIYDYLLVSQNYTFDIYLLISMGKEIPLEIKNQLEMIAKPVVSLKWFLRMLYMIPPRLILIMGVSESWYLDFCVGYEKLFKIKAIRTSNMLKKFVNDCRGVFR